MSVNLVSTLLLAAAAPAPEPLPFVDYPMRDYAPDLGRMPRWGAEDHEHVGRLKHQYARQPRSDRHRICRGRP